MVGGLENNQYYYIIMSGIMKRQTRYLVWLSLMLVAAFCWSCQKDSKLSPIKIVMEDWNGGNGAKVYIDGLYPRFEEGELVRINGGTYVIESIGNDGWGNLEWVSGKDSDIPPYYSVYPNAAAANQTLASTSTVTVKLPQRQYYQTVKVGNTEYQKLNAPMCAYTANSYQLHFKNVCSVMHLVINNTTGDTRYIDSIDVIADAVQLCGSMTVTGFGTDEPAVVAPAHTTSDDRNWVRLYGIGGIGGKRLDAGSTADYYIFLPSYSTNTKLTVKVYENGHGTKYQVAAEQPVSRTLVRNLMFTVPFNLGPEKPIGPTPVTGFGGFTVKMEGGKPARKVYLGYGNLYHDAFGASDGTDTFYIAAYQFSMRATATGDNIDWFTYSQGTSTNYGVGSSSRYTQANFVDWGKTVDTEDKWRTLSGEEWATMIGDKPAREAGVTARPNASSLYSYIQITQIPTALQNNGSATQRGAIIFPDAWDWGKVNVTQFTMGNTNFNNAPSVPFDDWLLLEEAGAIFLPYQPLPGENRVSYWTSGFKGDNGGTASTDANASPRYSLCFHTDSWGGIHDHGDNPMFVRLAINTEYVDIYPPKDEYSQDSKSKSMGLKKNKR